MLLPKLLGPIPGHKAALLPQFYSAFTKCSNFDFMDRKSINCFTAYVNACLNTDDILSKITTKENEDSEYREEVIGLLKSIDRRLEHIADLVDKRWT